jgi:cell division ATPase FtsA
MKMEAGNKHLLALDIGTRKVTGLLLDISAGDRRILAIETQEHLTRAMLDGQIQDIPKVAEVVSQIRARLEQSAGGPLEAAAVAAAGRMLCTMRGKASHRLDSAKRLREQDILQLEYAAVLEAQQQLFSAPGGKRRFTEQFHCVGFSVSGYFLDEAPIGNLLGQQGSLACCEVIATFLPRVVVDSLRGVLGAAGLRLQSLTLEPIAALRMVVPETMRKLNLALVDVGAGTSDIAITREGTAIAYDMVPLAGDEITESLCQCFLLDFLIAEGLKRKLAGNTRLTFRNILGKRIALTAAEVREALTPVLDELGQKIAGAILRHNGTAPQAVFCVGGGSLLPGLPDTIARYLGLDPAKVSVKGKEIISLLPCSPRQYRGPELVTPLGIAYTALQREALHFWRVAVNGQNIDVMDLGRGTVADALLAAGIGSRELVGRFGAGASIEVNGQLLTFPGERGEPARITVNGLPSSLDARICQGDEITCEPGKDGAAARVSVTALLSRLTPFSIRLNGKWYRLAPPVYRGSQLLAGDVWLRDRDKLRVLKTVPLSWVLEQLNLARELDGGTIKVRVNGTEREVPYGPKTIKVNGRAAVRDTAVCEGDLIETCFDGFYPTVSSLTEAKPAQIKLLVNGAPLLVPVREIFFLRNGRDVQAEALLNDGDQVEIREEIYEITVADLLNLIEWQSKPPSGSKRLILLLNGRDAQFTTAVKDGDSFEVGWT